MNVNQRYISSWYRTCCHVIEKSYPELWKELGEQKIDHEKEGRCNVYIRQRFNVVENELDIEATHEHPLTCKITDVKCPECFKPIYEADFEEDFPKSKKSPQAGKKKSPDSDEP